MEEDFLSFFEKSEHCLTCNSSTLLTENDIKAYLTDETQKTGFDFFCYAGRFFFHKTRPTDRVITNYPADLVTDYVHQKLIRSDPLVHHAIHKLTPLIWSVNKRINAEPPIIVFKKAQDYGIVFGVTFPVHRREGDVGLLSFATKTEDEQTHHLVNRYLPYGALLANCVHDGIRNELCAQGLAPQPRSHLTPRELECLKWVAVGKSNWEIAQILRISEPGVAFHLQNLMKKFEVDKRHQAVARALACGIL